MNEYHWNPDDWQRFEVIPRNNKSRQIGASTLVLARNATDAAEKGARKLKSIGQKKPFQVSVHAYCPALDPAMRGFIRAIDSPKSPLTGLGGESQSAAPLASASNSQAEGEATPVSDRGFVPSK